MVRELSMKRRIGSLSREAVEGWGRGAGSLCLDRAGSL
jgi:hypothetical protein